MIKSTGMIRKVDELGRIVIPKEIRNQLHIIKKDLIEIFVQNNSIILKKYQSNYIFCNSNENLKEYGNRLICLKCIEKINNINTDGNKNENNIL